MFLQVILAGLFTPGEMLKTCYFFEGGEGRLWEIQTKARGKKKESILKKTLPMWYGKGKRKRAKGAY
jgi:hypothetical protein